MRIKTNKKKQKFNKINPKSLLLQKISNKKFKKRFIKVNFPKKENKAILFRILFAVVNIILLLINIYFLFSKKIFQIKTFLDLRNIDQFVSILLTNSFDNIGNYLNSKYSNPSNLTVPAKNKEKKVIRVQGNYIFSGEEFRRTLLWYLQDKFIVKFDGNPDYIIFNVFVNNYPQCKKCIKIAIFTENVIPDLTHCDYALGHAHISHLDRYFTLPFVF